MRTRPLQSRSLVCFFACCVLVASLLPLSLLAQPDPLPTHFDLRDVDGMAYIGPVKNQSPLGTCYAFAAAAAAEGTYNLATNNTNNDGNPISLSESFIMWSLGQKYAGFPTDKYGQGGNYDYDELKAMVDYGDCTEEEFPYTSDWDVIKAYENDTDHELDYHWDAPRIQFAGFHRLPTNDIETIKRAIMTFGVVDAAVDATDEFSYYNGGIFSDNATTSDNPLEYFTTTNHAISLVGWDDNSTGEGEGSWILRNSWSENWGEDGYMRIGYTSARVATSICYLHYKAWNDHGFAHIDTFNNGTITGDLNATGYQPVARGLYEWGDDTSFMINNGNISATANVAEGDPYVHGMFLWAGNASRIENNNVINATASTDQGQSTAYGVCLQGHDVTNTGTITVNATSTDDRATAYGIRFFSFDENGTIENSGTITATAGDDEGWAYGLLSTDAATVLNTGNMTVQGSDAVSILSEGSTLVTNNGNLKAVATTNDSCGIFLYAGSVINTGTIHSVSNGTNGSAYGINSMLAEQIQNDRTIKARVHRDNGIAYGIYDYATEVIENNGLVDVRAHVNNGTAYGIYGKYTETIQNNQTIDVCAYLTNGTAYGIYGGATGLIANTHSIDIRATGSNGIAYGIYGDKTETIDNSQDINVRARWNNGTAYGIATNYGTTNNTGTIDVAATLNATGIASLGPAQISNSGSITALTFQGTACGINMQGGTLINNADGIISAATNSTTEGTAYGLYLLNATAYNNGTVVGDTFVGEQSLLEGYGTFNGTVLNEAGTVAPGNSIGTLTINGDYVQSSDGTLVIEFNNTASDQLIVTQTANLDGTLEFIPIDYTTDSSHVFLNATTTNGSFTQIVSPAVFNAYINNGIVDITRNTYASVGTNAGARGVAEALDQIRPSATGDMAEILNDIDRLQLAPLNDALDDMTPGMHAAASYASIQNTHRSMSYVRRHWKDLQTEAGREDTPYEQSERAANGTRFNAWGSFVGASSRTKTQDSIPGYNESMTGLVLGMDYTIGPKLTTGLATSYTTQSLNQEDGSGSATIKTFRGYVYGLWDENPETDGLYVSTALGFGSINFDTDRDIRFLRNTRFLDSEAESHHSGQDYSLLATTGYDIQNGAWTIRPNLNLEYVFLHEEGYDESDADAMNLHVDDHDSQSLQSVLGINIARRCRLKKAVLIPELRLAWMHEFLPEQDDLTSRFLTAGPSFDTPSRDIPQDAAVLGLAVKAPLSDMVFAAIDYECTLTEANESTDHRFNAELRIRF